MTDGSLDKRKIAAILAADVVGYSRLTSIDEPGTIQRLKILRKELLEPLINEWRGRIFKTMGDCYFAEFHSIVDAVNCAVLLQQRLQTHNEKEQDDRQIRFRIAINLCDIIIDRKDLQGDGVNVASRLQECAEPGGIVVSATAHDYLQGKISFPLEDIGEQRLKNIDRPVRAFRVRLKNGPFPQKQEPPRKKPSFSPTGIWLVSIALILAALFHPALRAAVDGLINRPLLVSGYVGGSKANLLEDPDVKRILRKKYGLDVRYEVLGGREQVCKIERPYDYVWPGTLLSVEDYKRCHGGSATFNSTLFSPIVIYAWGPVAEALSSTGLIERRSDGVFFIDTERLAPILLERNTSWPPTLGLRGSIFIATADPTRSNSGEMFAAMLVKVRQKQGGIELRQSVAEVKNYFANLGLKPPRTTDLFQHCYATGMRTCPMFVAYESLLADYVNENNLQCKNAKPLWIVYPRPTIWATHPLIAATAGGEKLLTALRDPAIQKIALDKHGFRIGARPDGPRGCLPLPPSDDIPSLQIPPMHEMQILQKALNGN
jgi:class 3 adenylate cyclase